MKQNIIAGLVQIFMTLTMTLLAISSFKLLAPEQIAFFRQFYLMPFVLATGLSAAMHNYLRSLFFAGLPLSESFVENRSLQLAHFGAATILLIGVLCTLDRESDGISLLNILALVVSVAVANLRILLSCLLEYRSRYPSAILLDNLFAALPYFAIIVFVFKPTHNTFFLTMLILSLGFMVVGFSVFWILNVNISWAKLFSSPTLFEFRPYHYIKLGIVSVGSVLVFQGVEFLFYVVTPFEKALIANYSLAFTVSAVLRQLVIVGLQPLQNAESFSSEVTIFPPITLPLPIILDMLIACGLIISTVLIPFLFTVFFPQYSSANSFLGPLLFGVMGSATQQIYAVRLVATSETSFIAYSQIAVATLSLSIVYFVNPYVSLHTMAILLGTILWLRGVIAVPLYAQTKGFKIPPYQWIWRLSLGALLFLLCF